MKPIKLISVQAAIALRMALYARQDEIKALPDRDRMAAQFELDHLLNELGIENPIQ